MASRNAGLACRRHNVVLLIADLDGPWPPWMRAGERACSRLLASSLSIGVVHFSPCLWLAGTGFPKGTAVFFMADQRPSDPRGVAGDRAGGLVSWHPGKEQLNSEIVGIVMPGGSVEQGLRPRHSKVRA